MITTPTIFDHNFDPQTVVELEELRNVRLGLAQQQLDNVEQTAFDLQCSGLHQNIGDDTFIDGLKTELEDKIAVLKSRIDQKGIFYTDEIQFYLSVSDNNLPA